MHPWLLAAAWWRLQLDALTLAGTAPIVVAHRFAKLGFGWHEPGFLDDPEWRRMVDEKIEAATEASGHAARWWLHAVEHPFDLHRGLVATRRALRPFGRRVTTNAHRLGG